MVPDPIRDLLDRRVPQYVAVYLGASWAVVEFFAFLEDRFLLSPDLTNLVLALLVLLLPSVVVFTYNHGRPGADRWVRSEKIFIPANLAIAAIVLFAGFSGRELGAVTTTVSTRDEEGRTLERTVPKSEFRRRVAFFPPDAPPDEPWLGMAVMLGMDTDLYQDMFVDLRTAPHYLELLRRRGLPDAVAVPRALEREVARELDLQYFADGTIRRTDAGYRLKVDLHDVERGDVVASSTFDAPRLLTLVDSASLALRRALALPATHIEGNVDVPAEELITESPEALRHYALGAMELVYDADYDAAESQLEQAVRMDSTFALANAVLYEVRILNGHEDGAREALAAAMVHLYRLPERLQFAVKAEHYAFRQEMPKAVAVIEMRAELYPQDIDAQLDLAEVRLYQDDLDGAIAALERALELDPTRGELLQRLGDLHRRLGHFTEAEESYRGYQDRVPDRPEPLLSLGRLRLAVGDHDGAHQSYERALLLDPDNVDILVALAELARATGDWDEAERRSAAALEAARTHQGRLAAYRELRRYSDYRHDHARTLEYQEHMIAEAGEFLPPMSVVVMEIVGLGDYVRGGRADEARARLARLSDRLPDVAQSVIVPLGRTEVWLALEKADSIRTAVEAAEVAIEQTGFEALAPRAVHARGRMHELRGEWEAALESYERELELDPSDASIRAYIGRVYREMGRPERAEQELVQALKVWPSHGPANYELGRVYLDAGRVEEAVRHLERALETWAGADPEDEQVVAARAALADARLRLRPVRPSG